MLNAGNVTVILEEPPALTVISDETAFGALLGTYSWQRKNNDGTSMGIESDSAHPLDCKDLLLLFETTDKTAALSFIEEPDSILSVRCWSDGHWSDPTANSEIVAINGNTIELKPGGYIKDKLLHGDANDRCIVAMSLFKEVTHLKSDLYTKHSLPIPFVSRYSPKLASDLATRGLDMANIITVGKQAEYAVLINTLIALFHGIFFDGSGDSERRLHEVKTRKILMYSNLVASSSNVAIVAVTQDMKKLDLGGLAVTIYRLVTDTHFIAQVKHEFISGCYFDMLDQI